MTSAIVLVTSVLTTVYYNMHDDNDQPFYKSENIPFLLVSMLVVFAVFLFLQKRHVLEKKRLMWAIGIVFITAYCMMLILAVKPQAVNDSKTLDNIINAFMQGDYSALTTKGGYLFIWPFQLGYVLFGEMVGRAFGPSNYFVWDVIQLISILITVFLIYKMTDEFFGDDDVSGAAALLSMGALFFYNFATYIYGDILSMAPQTLALFLTVLYVKRERIVYALLAAPCIAAAVVLKTNCEITLIAIVMIMILSTWGNIVRSDKPAHIQADRAEDKKRLLQRVALSVFMILCVFAAKKAVDIHYMKLAGIDKIPDGSPAVSHIAMGLQESDLENGWYNGYNYRVFEDNDYDTAATAKAAKENIKERLSDFTKDPGYAAGFFLRKFTTQWADPVCISTHDLDLVSRHVEDQPALCDFLVFGKGQIALRWIMNVFMSVCYLCVLVYLFTCYKKRIASPGEMLLLILIFGGILFHQFWEGSSRYAMRYYIYWLPFAAYGMKVLIGNIHTRGKR